MPASTLRSWVRGDAGARPRTRRLIVLPDPRKSELSFLNLVEAHVLRALRTEHRVAMPAVRKAIDYAEQKLGIEHLLVHPKLRTEGGELLLDQYGKLTSLSQSGQLAMREILQRHLRRITWDAKLPVRFFPIVSDSDGSESQKIVIDPRIAFGRPIVASKGVSTAAIRWRLDAGETPKDVAADYDITIDEVKEAAVYELAA